jgi:ABC-type multidrug transport system fused ATPase/permease subunit
MAAEIIVSTGISYAVFRYYLNTYPEHYKAQVFTGSLFTLIISYLSLPLYALLFYFINKFFIKFINKLKILGVLCSVLIILAGVGLQVWVTYVLEEPYDTHVQGW